MVTQKYINQIAYKIVGCAIEVHKVLGPGLLESVYEACLLDELKSQQLKVASQIVVPVIYKGKDLGTFLELLSDDLNTKEALVEIIRLSKDSSKISSVSAALAMLGMV